MLKDLKDVISKTIYRPSALEHRSQNASTLQQLFYSYTFVCYYVGYFIKPKTEISKSCYVITFVLGNILLYTNKFK